MSNQAATIGAALAFYCAFSLAPLLIILVTGCGSTTRRRSFCSAPNSPPFLAVLATRRRRTFPRTPEQRESPKASQRSACGQIQYLTPGYSVFTRRALVRIYLHYSQ
jgi:hypothetical protein